MRKLLVFTVIMMVAFVSIAQAEIPAAKRREIEKILRLTGVEKLMVQMKTQMISGMKTQMTQIPEEFWTSFESKMDMRALLEKIIPLYDKYYTIEDLKAVNAFYESTVGQKVLSTLPKIMQESMAIGQEWGENIAEQAAAEAEKELKNKNKK
jgi:uncharacterized protein